MANESTRSLSIETCSVEQLIASNTAKSLAANLRLSDVQVAKANQALLRIMSDEKLQGATQISKLRYCYSVAQLNYKNEKAVAPIKYGTGIQAQLQYYAYIEDVLDTGLVKAEDFKYVQLFEGIDYKSYIDGDGQVILEIPDKIIIKDPFSKPKVIGYYASIKTINGETFTCVMNLDEIKKHATTYSISYRAYLNKTSKSAIWGTNFEAMALKTVIKAAAKEFNKKHPTDRLEKSLYLDQIVFNDKGASYKDNPQNAEPSAVVEAKKTNITNSIIDFTKEEKADEETGEIKQEGGKEDGEKED